MTITLNQLKQTAGLTGDTSLLESLSLSKLTSSDKERLDRIKSHYQNLAQYEPLREDAVKMVILSPLLDLAGFYEGDFQIQTEVGIDLRFPYDETTRGRIDLLMIKDSLWILVVESKGEAVSEAIPVGFIAAHVAVPQLLSYMLSGQAVWGLVTTGVEFVFVRLQGNQFSQSYPLILTRPGDLEQVTAVLKAIA